MNNDLFDIGFKLAELNNTLKNIAALLILRERHESHTIADAKYQELLSILASNIIGGDA